MRDQDLEKQIIEENGIIDLKESCLCNKPTPIPPL